MHLTLDWGICSSRLAKCVVFWGRLTNISHTRSTASTNGTFRSTYTATLLQFHVPLMNCVHRSKTTVAQSQLIQFWQIPRQNALLFPVHAMFHHDYPLAVKIVLVAAQPCSEDPEGLMNYPIYFNSILPLRIMTSKKILQDQFLNINRYMATKISHKAGYS
jgi:hypothetical protein